MLTVGQGWVLTQGQLHKIEVPSVRSGVTLQKSQVTLFTLTDPNKRVKSCLYTL